MALDPHEIGLERSRALHRLIAERLRQDPSLAAPALERTERWLAMPGSPRAALLEWRNLLHGPADELLRALEATDEHADELRQSSPFAGVVGPRERWALWRSVAARVSP